MRKNRRKTQRVFTNTDGGFLFIEIVVACAIFVFAIVSAIKVYLDIAILMALSKEETTALNHASNIIETITGMDMVTVNIIESVNWNSYVTAMDPDPNKASILSQQNIAVNAQELYSSYPNPYIEYTANITWSGPQGRMRNLVVDGGRFTYGI
ncbi:hypothetical protein ACFL96_06440 [Thermoproteota archaeon]